MPIIPFQLTDSYIRQIMDLIQRDLSEPYTIYTYRYFLHQWTNLCFLYTSDEDMKDRVDEGDQISSHDLLKETGITEGHTERPVIGVIICRLEMHKGRNDDNRMRGYIGMLAVSKQERGRGLGRKLAIKAIEELQRQGAEEVVLETEITNVAALRLYEKLGFVRDKRLPRYYMSGIDAFRLKLWLR